MKYPGGCILQFAKAPELGRVKTRLQEAIGAEGALEVHQMLIEKVVATVTEADLCPLELWIAGDTTHHLFTSISERYPVSIKAQSGEDLGARMAHAIQHALARYDFVIVIGSDCCVLDESYLTLAVEQLDLNRAVIGPAEDGGYVLIGLRQYSSALFEEIEWGTDRVLGQTLARLEGLGWLSAQLPLRWDVDRPDDLERLIALDDSFAVKVASQLVG